MTSSQEHEIEKRVAGAIQFGIFFTAKSILRKKLTLAEVRRLLGDLDQKSALNWAAEHSIGNHLHIAQHFSWRSTKENFAKLVEDMLPSEYHTRAWKEFEDERFISPFSELGFVLLFALICRYCPATGGQTLDSPTHRWKLTQALLAVQDSFIPEDLIRKASEANGNELTATLKQQFPYVTRMVLANTTLQNKWAYDMGRLHAFTSIPEIGGLLASKNKGMTVAEWFERRLNIPAIDYEVMTNVQFGASIYRADVGALRTQFPSMADSIEKLVSLASITPAEVIKDRPEPLSLYDIGNDAESLLIRPLIKVENRYLVSSVANLFNKFHRGLPYLALEARQLAGTSEAMADARAEFGAIFQGYVTWLFTRWFAGTGVEIVPEYWVAGCGILGRGGEPYERDLLLIHEDIGYVFEIKAAVPSLAMRRRSKIADYRDSLQEVTKQAYHAAQALIEGKAFLDAEMKSPIPKLKRVYPCGVGYEFNALRWPYSDFFERSLEFALAASTFRNTESIAPVQYLDIQQIEMLDDMYQLPNQISDLFAMLRTRAEDPLLRYCSFHALAEFRTDFDRVPGLVRKLVDEAEQSTSKRLDELKAKRN